jgi:DNA-binding MarR family transcriptional regulator
VDLDKQYNFEGSNIMENSIDATVVCACINVRRTDNVIAQFYDGVLAPSGLYAIQFGLLGAVIKLTPATVNRLAKLMDMDRATLNRHLKMLTYQNLIRYEGEDQRTRTVLLTSEGEQAFMRARPLWQEAQEYIEQAFGQEHFKAFLGELKEIRTLLSSGIS